MERPLVPEPEPIVEAGARNSASDLKMIQTLHDHAVSLGASCGAKESAAVVAAPLKLTESASTLETIVLREARADYEIKLIAPGKGSSAFYPAEVLKRDGPKVFKASTHVYLNHPTAAEESQRPEGDVSNLAGVLTTDAVYQESHAKGPGLYARMKVFADHATMVEEKAPHVGMSIRASGIAEAGRVQEGVPVLKELTGAESVDVVTRAGAGGMILTEAARPGSESQQENKPMAETGLTLAEAQRLITEAVTAATKPLIETNMKHEAVAEAGRLLETVTLPQPAKVRIIERATASIPKTAEGAFDVAKFREAVVAESKAEGEYLAAITGNGRVLYMGGTPVQQPTAEQVAAREAAAKREDSDALDVFTSLMGDPEAAKIAARGRVA